MDALFPPVIIVGVWVGIGWLCAQIAVGKGRSAAEGWALGLLVGPIGLIVEAMLADQTPPPRPRTSYTAKKDPVPSSVDEMDVAAWLQTSVESCGRTMPR